MDMLALELVRELSLAQPRAGSLPRAGEGGAAVPRHSLGSAGAGQGGQNISLNTAGGVAGASSGPRCTETSAPVSLSGLHIVTAPPSRPPLIALCTSARSGRKGQPESANTAPFCVSAGARSWTLFFNPLTG